MARNPFHQTFGQVKGNRSPRDDSPILVEVVDPETGVIETTEIVTVERATGMAHGQPPRGKLRLFEPLGFDRRG